MAIAFRSAGTITTPSGTSGTASYTATAGDLLVVSICHASSSSVTSVSSSLDGALTLIGHAGSGSVQCTVYALLSGTTVVGASGGSHTVTVNVSASTQLGIVVFGYSGAATVVTGGVATNNGFGTSASAGPVTNSSGNVILAVGIDTAPSTLTMSTGTKRNDQADGGGVLLQMIVADAPGTGSGVTPAGTYASAIPWAWLAVDITPPGSGGGLFRNSRLEGLGSSGPKAFYGGMG